MPNLSLEKHLEWAYWFAINKGIVPQDENAMLILLFTNLILHHLENLCNSKGW